MIDHHPRQLSPTNLGLRHRRGGATALPARRLRAGNAASSPCRSYAGVASAIRRASGSSHFV